MGYHSHALKECWIRTSAMKISVITINRNNAAELEKTIRSVSGQTYANIEYIVIDGASTDNSVDIITLHTECIQQWISEPDTGIYNAMNKGIARATGDWLIFMNAGDTFADNTIVQQFVDGQYSDDIVFGNQIRILADGSENLWQAPDTVDFLFFYRSGIPHQSTFYKKALFEQTGPFREDFRIYSDWAHAELAVLKHGASCKPINLTISIYDKTGISSDPKHRSTRRQEISICRNEMFPIHIWDMADECLRLRIQLELLNKNPIVRFAISTCRHLRKSLAKNTQQTKHLSVIRRTIN